MSSDDARNGEFQLSPRLEALAEEYAADPTSRKFRPLAEEYRKSRMYEEAIYICKEGLKHHPDFTPGKITLARCMLESGEKDEALLLLINLVDEEPENIPALRLLGDTYFAMNDLESAQEQYSRVLAINPQDEAAQKGLQRVQDPIADTADLPDADKETIEEINPFSEADVPDPENDEEEIDLDLVDDDELDEDLDFSLPEEEAPHEIEISFGDDDDEADIITDSGEHKKFEDPLELDEDRKDIVGDSVDDIPTLEIDDSDLDDKDTASIEDVLHRSHSPGRKKSTAEESDEAAQARNDADQHRERDADTGDTILDGSTVIELDEDLIDEEFDLEETVKRDGPDPEERREDEVILSADDNVELDKEELEVVELEDEETTDSGLEVLSMELNDIDSEPEDVQDAGLEIIDSDSGEETPHSMPSVDAGLETEQEMQSVDEPEEDDDLSDNAENDVLEIDGVALEQIDIDDYSPQDHPPARTEAPVESGEKSDDSPVTGQVSDDELPTTDSTVIDEPAETGEVSGEMAPEVEPLADDEEVVVEVLDLDELSMGEIEQFTAETYELNPEAIEKQGVPRGRRILDEITASDVPDIDEIQPDVSLEEDIGTESRETVEQPLDKSGEDDDNILDSAAPERNQDRDFLLGDADESVLSSDLSTDLLDEDDIEIQDITDTDMVEPHPAERQPLDSTEEEDDGEAIPVTLSAAGIFEKQGHYKKAKRIYRLLLDDNPRNEKAREGLLRCAEELQIEHEISTDDEPAEAVSDADTLHTLKRWLQNIEAFRKELE